MDFNKFMAMIDRLPNIEETTWFIDRNIPPPDRVILALQLDSQWRYDGQSNLGHEVPHPFPVQRSPQWRGCYLFYGIYQNNDIAPIYAGYAKYLANRLHQHFHGQQSTMLERYFQKFAWPDNELWIAIWYLPEREMIRFEHLLLAHLEPIQNMV